MSENPASLLSRFVGFHAITLYNLTIHFMVMQSVFLTNRKIHERYDLKGSTVDRHAAKPKPVRVPSGTVIDPVTGLRRPSSGAGAASMRRRGAFRNVVFKDNDLNRTVRLSARDRDTFLRQVRRDAFFLKSCNIMDYSLLLGVHHTSYQVPALSPTSPRPVSPGSPAAAVAASGGSSGNGTSPVGSSGPPALLALSPPSTGGMLSSADSSFASPNGHGSGAYTNRSSSVWSNASGGGGGLHTSASSVAPAPAGVFQSCDGGVQASIIEGPGIYFFGIIDILQEYNTNKKLEQYVHDCAHIRVV
jgi:1-phosphatidylinositol-4-phosphate 5-kinase